jgi:hypothetical protein
MCGAAKVHSNSRTEQKVIGLWAWFMALATLAMGGSIKPMPMGYVMYVGFGAMIGLSRMRVFRAGADKRPRVRAWPKAAMAQRRIPKEWERVAVPTGAVNGVDVLDVDTKNGATEWWWQQFEALTRGFSDC